MTSSGKEANAFLTSSLFGEAFVLCMKVLIPIAALEFFMLRVFMRISFLVTDDQTLASLLVVFGQYVFNTAYAFSTLALILLSVALGKRRSYLRVLPIVLAMFILVDVLIFANPTPILRIVYLVTSLALVILSIGLSIDRRSILATIFLLNIASVYAISVAYSANSMINAPWGFLSGAAALLGLSELLAVVSPIAAFAVLRPRWSPSIVAAGTIITAIFMLMMMRSPSTSLVSTWAVYFTLHLHPALYAVGLWLFTIVVISLLCSNNGEAKMAGFGYLLLFFTGLMLQLSYFVHLAVLGTMLLSFFFKPPFRGISGIVKPKISP